MFLKFGLNHCTLKSMLVRCNATVPLALSLLGSMGGCGASLPTTRSLGESQSSFTYIPIDPLPTSARLSDTCAKGQHVGPYMDLLPDEAVRIAIASSDASGNLTIGPAATIGAQDNIYQVTLDYISVDTKSVPVLVKREHRIPLTAPTSTSPAKEIGSRGSASAYTLTKDPNSKVWSSYKSGGAPTSSDVSAKEVAPNEERVVVPVYVGVGLRLVATVKVIKGNVNLASLGAITASVAAGEATGSLVVQTLGISGPKVSTIMPLPSDLNQTTVQNAILALGSIKAILYDHETKIVPRVVGIYNPIGGGSAVVNQIISFLVNDKVAVDGTCMEDSVNGGSGPNTTIQPPTAAPAATPPPTADPPSTAVPPPPTSMKRGSASGHQKNPGSAVGANK
jgi:hypothetical protein